MRSSLLLLLLLLLLLDARTAEPRHANSAGWTNATGSALVAYCGYMAAFGPTEGNEEDDYLSVFPRRFVFGEGFHRPRLHFLSATAAHPSDRSADETTRSVSRLVGPPVG
jgi:hypothetical protein